MALDELIWKIYSDTGFYNYVGLMPNGKLRQANLKMLFQKAKQYESSNFRGLYSFINFIDKLKTSSGDLGAAKIIGENENVVRIMSIHKSKGLEFPVVFLSSTNKQFNLMDLNENVLLHQEMGIGAKYIDYDKQVQYDTLTKMAIKNKIFKDTLSEEMRILYVALTRAKEKIFITGLSKDYEKNINKIIKQVEQYSKDNNKIEPILLKQYKKYIDWILVVYEYEKENAEKFIKLDVHKKQEVLGYIENKKTEEIDVIEKLENAINQENFNNINESEENKNIIKTLEEKLNYKYPFIVDTKIPTKTSVTALKELAIKEKNSTNNFMDLNKRESINTIEKDTDITEFNNMNSIVEFPKPKFLNASKEEKITSAKKGTLVHMCLQRLNEKENYDFNKIKQLIETLQAKKIITEKEAQSININKVLAFTKSKIWTELKEAKEVCKEKHSEDFDDIDNRSGTCCRRRPERSVRHSVRFCKQKPQLLENGGGANRTHLRCKKLWRKHKTGACKKR